MEKPTAGPIEVKAHAAPIITSEIFKAFVIAAGAAVADRLVHSDNLYAAAVPVVAVVAVVAWSLLHRLHTWRCLKFLANYVSDQVATVGRRP
jgi:hypothetical protein